MLHRNNPKYTSNSTSTLLKNEQVIAQERVCIYGVTQCGNKVRLFLVFFTHQWKKIPLDCRVLYKERGNTLCCCLEEKKPLRGPTGTSAAGGSARPGLVSFSFKTTVQVYIQE